MGFAHVEDRETVEVSALTSPLRLSLDAALVIGLLAALTVVVIGFWLHFRAIGRSRVTESAIMRANGLPWRVVEQSLLVEQLVVLGHGMVVGSALGALLAWTVLPVLQTGILTTARIPPTIVTLNGATLAAGGIAIFVAAAVVGQFAIRSASRFRLNNVLRAMI